jgi:hypothetical protein
LRAIAYVAAPGTFKFSVNGHLASDNQLGAYTQFDQRVLYDSLDVTALLVEGCNALGVILGTGWYGIPSQQWGANRHGIVHLAIALKNGSSITVVSDSSWDVTQGESTRLIILGFNLTAINSLGHDYQARSFRTMSTRASTTMRASSNQVGKMHSRTLIHALTHSHARSHTRSHALSHTHSYALPCALGWDSCAFANASAWKPVCAAAWPANITLSPQTVPQKRMEAFAPKEQVRRVDGTTD